MKLHAIACAILASSVALSGPAFAQGEGNRGRGEQRGERGEQRQEQRGDRGHDQRDFGHQRGQRGWEQQRQRAQQDRRADDDRDQRGAGPDHGWHRGDRLPPEYRHRNYVVEDWRGHHLNPPPRGYHWVQVGGDYVLVAIATGLILQLLLNN
jgi:Ni/Co efflux regulator RcnB